MRRILVDRARYRKRVKHGGDLQVVSLDRATVGSRQSVTDVLEIDEALDKLAQLDQRKARIVELRFFGGLEVQEAAAFLNISEITVLRDWKMAKAWLHKELSGRDS